MQLRFICGENATYASLIASDHGAPYAKSLRLPCSGVSSLGEPASGSEAVIIDDNLTEDEARLVRKFVERQQAPVLLKVVDPYWVRGNHGRRKTTYSALVETYCRLPNVAILSPYEPSEWLRMVVDKFHPKLLVLPYPYVAEAERPLDFEGFSALADMTDDERREWFIRHDNYWVQ